jgi:hypothetical protein
MSHISPHDVTRHDTMRAQFKQGSKDFIQLPNVKSLFEDR